MTKKNITAIITAGIMIIGLVLLALFGRPLISRDVKTDITAQVIEFGETLRNVALLSDTAGTQIKREYAPYVAPELLETWAADPSEALGRNVSSPWPERIEVQNIQKISDTQYEVTGEVIEVTSAEKPGEVAASYGIKLTVERRRDAWLIMRVTKNSY